MNQNNNIEKIKDRKEFIYLKRKDGNEYVVLGESGKYNSNKEIEEIYLKYKNECNKIINSYKIDKHVKIHRCVDLLTYYNDIIKSIENIMKDKNQKIIPIRKYLEELYFELNEEEQKYLYNQIIVTSFVQTINDYYTIDSKGIVYLSKKIYDHIDFL